MADDDDDGDEQAVVLHDGHDDGVHGGVVVAVDNKHDTYKLGDHDNGVHDFHDEDEDDDGYDDCRSFF